jgi:hypothetical protein
MAKKLGFVGNGKSALSFFSDFFIHSFDHVFLVEEIFHFLTKYLKDLICGNQKMLL